MAFATLITSELLRSYSARSIRYTLFHIGPFTTRKIVWATIFSFVLMIVVMYVPTIRELFQLDSIGMNEWIVILVASVIPLVLGEIQKVIRFKKYHDEFEK